MSEKESNERIIELNRLIVERKKTVAKIIAVRNGLDAQRDFEVRQVHAMGAAILDVARRGDFASADRLYRERTRPFERSQKTIVEARATHEAVEADKDALRKLNGLIELLKKGKNVLIARRAGGGHAFARPHTEPMAAAPAPIQADNDDAHVLALAIENERLTELYEELRAWPAVLERLAR